MKIQSYLCQLGVKDLEEIAKTLGCSDDDTKEKNRKELVRLIEEQLEGTLEGTKADKMERLEEFKSRIMNIRLFVLCWKQLARKRSLEFLNRRLERVSLNLKM